jgi:putative toxin-antitoxin system antitoxin component (TIGR02293 family)
VGNPSIQHLVQVDFNAIVPVIAHAVAVFGDEHKATHWLSTALPILDGRTPTEVLQTPGGAARIETILTRIEHSIPS